ncbi:MAG: 2-isopropylmalate synthase [Planctomycetes bacterium]|nr:2-isopropylmalate synthase [Planctomycetota bacterium]
MFPHSKLPRVVFDGQSVPLAPAKNIWITDTTFRDGQQARPPYEVSQIVDIYKLLHKLDGGTGLIRASEFFIYSKKDLQAVEKCLELGFDYPRVTGWILARKEDLKLVKNAGLSETGILTSCSDYHIFLKLNKTRKQAMEMYLDVARSVVEAGVAIRCHFEDITRADFPGLVIPLAIELMKLREQSGVDVKIRLCDTLGFGVPWPEASLPRSLPKIVYAMINEAGVPGELLEWHGHNDFHKVLINPTTAWLYGCSAANGSLLGIGERTGNTPVEALVVEAAQLRGMEKGVKYEVITEIADYFRNEIGYAIPSNFPLVGVDFNTTRAGIHTDGLIKSEEIYTAFDTQKILNRPVGVIITDKCGAAGIKHWIDAHYGLNVAKDDARLMAVRNRVAAQYESGRTTAISDEEMHAWYAEAFNAE